MEATECLPPPQPKLPTHPEFIYSFRGGYNNTLHRMRLTTQEPVSLPLSTFSCITPAAIRELPSGDLWFTGIGNELVETIIISSMRDFATVKKASMSVGRRMYGAVHYAGYVYVIGGKNVYCMLSSCERHNLADDTWEDLPPLTIACIGATVNVLESTCCLYALGGCIDHRASQSIASIQELSLETMTWSVLSLSLPFQRFEVPCFKYKDPSKLYFIIGKGLYVLGSSPDSARDLRITQVKTLPHYMHSTNLDCYFFNGNVFFGNYGGEPVVRTIGEI
jgi:hypothetical protein